MNLLDRLVGYILFSAIPFARLGDRIDVYYRAWHECRDQDRVSQARSLVEGQSTVHFHPWTNHHKQLVSRCKQDFVGNMGFHSMWVSHSVYHFCIALSLHPELLPCKRLQHHILLQRINVLSAWAISLFYQYPIQSLLRGISRTLHVTLVQQLPLTSTKNVLSWLATFSQQRAFFLFRNHAVLSSRSRNYALPFHFFQTPA